MSLFKSSKKKKKNDYVEPWEKKDKDKRFERKREEYPSYGENFEPIEQIIPEEAYAYDNPYSVYYHKQPGVPVNPNIGPSSNVPVVNANTVPSQVPANQANAPVISAVPPLNVGTTNIAPNNVVYPNQVPGKQKKEPFVYKPRIMEKKLIILLIENTAEMAKENDSIIKLSEICKDTDWLYIIHYGKDIKTKKVEFNKFFKKNDDINLEDLKCSKDATEDSCFMDAISEVTKIVSDLYGKIKEVNKVTTKVTSIEIIGIGTCKDNCSKTSKDDGIKSFCKMLNDTRIKSKYFCLNESSFFDAAETGFRSIGAINRSYY